jgi:hypothetical protein
MDNKTILPSRPDRPPVSRDAAGPAESRGAAPLKPLVPGMRWLLFTAAVLVLLAGFQLFIFTGRTGTYFAWTIVNPLAAAFLGGGYWASVCLEALAGRQRLWANTRIAVPAVFVFTVLTLAATFMHLGQFHLGRRFGAGTQIVTVAWIAIYVLVPLLMLIIMIVQARAPGADPPRQAGLPAWLYAVLGVQAIVLLGFGLALFAVPAQAAPLWPWKLTPLVAQATGAWLISLGVAAGHALLERDARRLRPAAVAYILLAVLEFIALARYPHRFDWQSSAGVIYLAFLATTLLSGGVILARGLPRPVLSGLVRHLERDRRRLSGPARQGAAQLRARADAQFAVDGGDVCLHGPHTDEQRSRGLTAGRPGRDLVGDAALGLGQTAARPGRRSPRQLALDLGEQRPVAHLSR